MRAVIVDDKLMNVKLLAKMLGDIPESVEIVGTALRIDEAIKMIDKLKPALIFLDIDMGEGYGFDVINGCEFKDFEVIFVTAFPNYALKSYEYAPLHFLTKPIDKEDLREGLNRFNNRRNALSQQQTLLSLPQRLAQKPRRICLPDSEQLKIVTIEDIVYCEASNVYTIFHFQDGTQLVVTKTLSNYEELLEDDGFCRIHESHLVNLSYVVSYRRGRGGEVELLNGKILPVAARRKDTFLKKLNRVARR